MAFDLHAAIDAAFETALAEALAADSTQDAAAIAALKAGYEATLADLRAKIAALEGGDDPPPPPPPPPMPGTDLYAKIMGLTAPHADVVAFASKPTTAPATAFAIKKWISDLSFFADYHYKLVASIEGVSKPQAEDWHMNFYDRVYAYRAHAARGVPAPGSIPGGWIASSDRLLANYRDIQIVAGQGFVQPHECQPTGMALHYLATNDAKTLKALGIIGDYYCSPNFQLFNTEGDMEGRQQARILKVFLYCHLLKIPSVGYPGRAPGGNNWEQRARKALDDIFKTINPDGSQRFKAWAGRGVNAYMTGILWESLIAYKELFEDDPRIEPAIKSMVDYVWAHNWRPGNKAFAYLESDPNPTPETADLNGFMLAGFGWLYAHGKGDVYRDHAALIFQGMVGTGAQGGDGKNGAWLHGYKQFNQVYQSSWKAFACLGWK